MTWPVYVAIRPVGVSARCEHHGCGNPHQLYQGSNVRDAEHAADAHLKEIRDGQVAPLAG